MRENIERSIPQVNRSFYLTGDNKQTYKVEMKFGERLKLARELDNENLGGGYASPHQALDDLAGGHCDWPGSTDPATLGISDDLGDWQPLTR